MEKENKQKLFAWFEKHKGKVIAYNIAIWFLFIVLFFQYLHLSNNTVSPEELKQQAEKRCDNNITLPEDGSRYAIKFTRNSILNMTFCEVILPNE